MKQHFTISKNDEFKAKGFDKNGKLIASWFDSGCSCISQVFTGLRNAPYRSSQNSIRRMTIENFTQDSFVSYKVYGVEDYPTFKKE